MPSLARSADRPAGRHGSVGATLVDRRRDERPGTGRVAIVGVRGWVGERPVGTVGSWCGMTGTPRSARRRLPRMTQLLVCAAVIVVILGATAAVRRLGFAEADRAVGRQDPTVTVASAGTVATVAPSRPGEGTASSLARQIGPDPAAIVCAALRAGHSAAQATAALQAAGVSRREALEEVNLVVAGGCATPPVPAPGHVTRAGRAVSTATPHAPDLSIPGPSATAWVGVLTTPQAGVKR
jgi:hypothetical protein